MEFTIYDAASYGCSGPRYRVVETNHQVETEAFTTLKAAKAWLEAQGLVYKRKPGLAYWAEA